MEQEVETTYRTVCTTCLCNDRNLFHINTMGPIYQVFGLLMYDFPADRFGEALADADQLVCWECLAVMRRVARFKLQVHSAQEHLRVLALSRAHETMDHTYMSQSLSSLEVTTKTDFDKIFFDYTASQEWGSQYIAISSGDGVKNEQFDVVQAVRDNINLDGDEHKLEVPQIVLENPVTGVMSHVVVGTDALVTRADITAAVKGEELAHTLLEERPAADAGVGRIILVANHVPKKDVQETKPAYLTECMSEAEMLQSREAEKLKVQYASSVYKCELCIIGFYTQQQVENHFLEAHSAKPGHSACKVCYVYIPEARVGAHVSAHYTRHTCRLCGHGERAQHRMAQHVREHVAPAHADRAAILIGDKRTSHRGRLKKPKDPPAAPPKPGDLRKLLSKTTIEGYKCLECDMFFKNSRARQTHVARYHREGLQCDHCKKRFVNRSTLATHLRLHEGPLPRDECPICHKLVRCIQLKYHIQRHEDKGRYKCVDCDKIFSHLATYQGHLKYSRAHASDQVFKFPCPMCNKGYPTKEQMQDHFNYQHLGKTAHKCPICDKPIASKANVEKHMSRVHGEKKVKPKTHQCQQCGKFFTDRKALVQHAVIHSGERPLSCDICHQTFKQKASLYTHRKRVHKVFPPKRNVEFMDAKPEDVNG